MNNLAAIINEQGLLPLTTIIKISIAFILGGIIGLERESKGKPVGFKTCVILSVASCVLTVVSIQSAEYYAEIAPPNPPETLPYSSGAVAMAVFSLMVPDSISASE